jgi:dTDP-4-amino-4,6-dideoxygalactose transaminase
MADVPWHTLHVDDASSSVERVLRSGYVNEGPEAERFGAAVAARVGAHHGLTATSGTAAIALALWASSVPRDAEVIVPDLTFVGTASAVSLVGARPVPVDVDAVSLTLDPAEVAAAITPKTAAIIAVQLNGRGAPLEELREIIGGRRIALVEDAAQALGSSHRGRPLGAIADVGCLSFAPTKILSTGQGGMVLTSSDELAQRVRAYKDQGRSVRHADAHPFLGFNFRLSDVLAAMGTAQLRILDERVARVRRNQQLYAEGLSGLSGLELVPVDLDGGQVPAYHGVYAERRERLAEHLSRHGIATRPFWAPVSSLAPYGGQARCPRALAASQKGLWLPGGPDLSADVVHRVVDVVRTFARTAA